VGAGVSPGVAPGAFCIAPPSDYHQARMNRIDAAFAALRAAGRKAFIPYLTAGLPDFEVQAELLAALESAGVTLVELGIPYSDPIADGPVIQASYTEALARGVTRAKILEMVRRSRAAGLKVPLAAMVSYAIVHRVGPERYVAEAAAAGFDGAIVPDLPVDEAAGLAAIAARHDFRLILLVAPTTPPQRRKRIAEISTGFLYCLSITGITGERAALPADLADNVRALKADTDKPVCVGFGIGTPAHVAAAVREADGVIVGSALVRAVREAAPRGRQAVVDAVRGLVERLMAALPGARTDR
jgi:tryptophan synthase alpha chain